MPKNIEEEIIKIQKSTKTIIPAFIPVHDRLRQRFHWYYYWHTLPYAGPLHWAIFVATISVATFIVVSSLIIRPGPSLAATADLLPTSDGATVQWRIQPTDPTTHYTKIDETTPDTSDYTWFCLQGGLSADCSGGSDTGKQDVFNDFQTATIGPAGAVVDYLEIKGYTYFEGNDPDGWASATVEVSKDGSTWVSAGSLGATLNTNAWHSAYATDLAWSQADLDGLQARLTVDGDPGCVGLNSCYVIYRLYSLVVVPHWGMVTKPNGDVGTMQWSLSGTSDGSCDAAGSHCNYVDDYPFDTSDSIRASDTSPVVDTYNMEDMSGLDSVINIEVVLHWEDDPPRGAMAPASVQISKDGSNWINPTSTQTPKDLLIYSYSLSPPWTNAEANALQVKITSDDLSGIDYTRIYDVHALVTSISVPTVTTSAASLIEQTTARLNGNITATGGENANRRGFYYGTASTYLNCSGTPSDAYETGNFGVGAFYMDISGLTANTIYYFRAYATNSAGTGTGSCLSLTTKPTVSTNAASGVTDTSAWLNGTVGPAGSNGVITTRGFNFYTGSNCVTPASPPTTSESGSFSAGSYSLQRTGLSPSTAYSYKAYATNAGGTTTATNCENFTTAGAAPPAAPSNAYIDSATTSALTTHWTDNSSDETGFKVQQQDNCVGGWTTVYTTPAGATSYEVGGLSENTSYCFRILATNANGDSVPSNTTRGKTKAIRLEPATSLYNMITFRLRGTNTGIKDSDTPNIADQASGSSDSIFTRNDSDATYRADDGTIQTVQNANDLRFEKVSVSDNPRAPSGGVRIEGTRTNLVLNSSFENRTGNDFDNWVESVAGSTTITASSDSVHSSTSAAINVVAGSGYGLFHTNAISISGNTAYTVSFYGKASTTGKYIDIRIKDNENYTLCSDLTWSTSCGYWVYKSLSTQWQRYSFTFTTRATATSFPAQQFSFVRNGTGDYSIYLDAIQLEAGAYDTSYIPTTTAAATRNWEDLTYPSSGNISGSGTISMWVKPPFSSQAITGSDRYNGLLNWGYGADNGLLISFLSTAGGGRIGTWITGKTFTHVAQTWSANQWMHIAVTYGTNQPIRIYRDGQLVGTSAGQDSAASSSAAIAVGRWGSTHVADSLISDLTIFNTALDADTIQGLYNGYGPSKVAISTPTVDQQLTVTWQDNSGNEDATTGFTVEYKQTSNCTETSGWGGTTTKAANTTSHDQGSLGVNLAYCFRVRGNVSSFNSPYQPSSTAKYTLARAPGDLNVQANSWNASDGNSMNFTFTANGNPNGTNYYTEFKEVNNSADCAVESGYSMVQNWTAHNNGDTLTHQNRTADKYICYRIKARNGDNIETSWNSGNAQSAPAQVQLGPSHNGVLGHINNTTSSITWAWNANSVSPSGYRVYEYSGGTCTETQKADAGPATSVEEGSLSANSPFSRCLRAYRGTVLGQYSATATAYTSANPPVNASHSGNTSIGITWTWASGGAQNNFFASDETGNSGWIIGTTWDANSGHSPNTQYNLSVKANNGDGDETDSITASAYTSANIPGAPTVTGMDWDPSDTWRLKIVVNKNGNPEGPAPAGDTPYAISCNESGTSWLQDPVGGKASCGPTEVWHTYSEWGGASGVLEVNLAGNALYSLKTKARNNDTVPDETDLSGSGSGRTAPLAPSALTSSDLRPTRGTTSWVCDLSCANPASTHTLSYGTNAEADNLGTISVGSDTSQNLLSLNHNTTYYFKIRATNTNGTGPYSAPASFKTTIATKLFVVPPGQSWSEPDASVTGVTDTQTAGQPFNFTVYGADDNNWFDPQYDVLVSSTSTDGAANLPTPANLVAGQKTFTITLNTVGWHTITATGSTGTSSLIQVVAGSVDAGTSSVTADPTQLYVDQTSTITIYLRDAAGNPISGHTVLITTNQAGDVISYYNQTTDANGRAVGYVTSPLAHISTVTVLDQTAGINLDDQPQITFMNQPAAPPVDTAPVAKIVGPSRAVENSMVTLDGRGSYDDVGIVGQEWAIQRQTQSKELIYTGGLIFNNAFTPTGNYVVYLTVWDSAGNKGEANHNIAIVPPAPVITEVKSVAGDLVVLGTSVPSAKITLHFSNSYIGETNSDWNGVWSWSHPINPDFPAGKYTVNAIAVDQNQMTSDPSDDFPFEITKAGEVVPGEGGVINRFVDTVKKIGDLLSPSKNKALQKFGQYIARPVGFLSVIFGLLTALFGLNFLNWALYLYYLLLLAMEALGLRRRRSPWGTVYDAKTKAPLGLVIVRLFDKKSEQLKETQVTDFDGRYGFLVEEGEYYLKIAKPGYIFPSRIVKKDAVADDVYSNLYHGQTIAIKPGEPSVSFDIPADPIGEGEKMVWRERLKNQILLARYLIKKIIIPLLIVGFLLSTISMLTSFTVMSAILSGTALILLGYEISDYRRRISWGIVYNSQTKNPIKGALVKIYDKEYGRLRDTHLTDEKGRFGFIVPPGKYTLDVEKAGYRFPSKIVKFKNDGKYHFVYHGDVLERTEKDLTITVNIPIDKIE